MKFFQSSALLFALPCALAIDLSVPSSTVAGTTAEITWTSTPTDPATFTLFLLNATNLPFGLRADFGEVQTSAGATEVVLPDTLPSGDYVLRAVNSSSVDFVYDTSPTFPITAA